MYAVIFEVLPTQSGMEAYLGLAAALRPQLEQIDGFISVERFRNLMQPGWLLSLSMWRDEAALIRWRSHGEHHAAQTRGRDAIFDDYRIRVAAMSAQAGGSAAKSWVGIEENPSAQAVQDHKLFESLTTPEKRLALAEFSSADATRAWRAHSGAAISGMVLRDYGLFERAQAPQKFSAARRR
jgi:heme-degrading monooxygenase HmoA